MGEVQCSDRMLPERSFRELDAIHAFKEQALSSWNKLALGDKDAEDHLQRIARLSLAETLKGISESIQPTCPEPGKPYCWDTLLSEPALTLGVLQIPRGGLIPAHNHPDTTGLSLVLSGHPRMIQADGMNPDRYTVHMLHPGALCFTYPEHNNLHGFSAPIDIATLISLKVCRDGSSRHLRHWKFSVEYNERLRQRFLYYLMHGMFLLTVSAWSQMALASDCVFDSSPKKPLHTEHWTMTPELKNCADAGYPDAQYELGNIYLLGHGVRQDAYTAAQWYRNAALQGHVEAQYSYGIMLLDGNGITEDAQEAFDWIYKAAHSGHSEARSVFEYLLKNPAPLDC